MNLRALLALSCFIISQGTIFISYLIAIQFDHPYVETCMPFLQGCLNITDAGIYSPEGYVFRGGMITACAFFIVWWVVSYQHLKPTSHHLLNLGSTLLGILGAILLIIATAVLIPPREAINWPVHIAGASSFFLVTFVAQALHFMLCLQSNTKQTISDISFRTKLIAVILQSIMIAILLGLKITQSGDLLGNALEWWLALLIAVYFFSGYFDWKEQKNTH